MLKLVGFISRQMYHTQQLTMLSPELKKYTLPMKVIGSLDIDRKVMYNEETGEVELETLKAKGQRLQNLFIIEKAEGRPIIGIDTEIAK